jgi:Tol biopolymer transport system component
MWVRCAVVAAALVCGAGSAGCGARPAASNDVPPNQHDLWALDTDSGRLKDLTRTKANEFAPAFSPDGKQIAYYGGVYRQGLYVMEAKGGAQHRIASGQPAYRSLYDAPGPPAWSPDGTRLAWATARGCNELLECAAWEVWAVGADGSAPALVSSTGASPTWSPDGKQIAYEGDLGKEGSGKTIYVADADGRTRRRIAKGYAPAWSSTGWIAYLQGAGLFVVRADGSDAHRVVTGQIGPRIAWTEDGTRLGFELERSHAFGDIELFSVAPDGNDVARLTRKPGEDRRLAWAPSGKTLAWLHQDVLAPANPGYDLMTNDTRGAGTKRLLDVSLTGADDPPTWSQDGRTIVLSLLPPDSDAKREPVSIWSMDVGTGEASPLAGAAGDAERPSVSPDGHRLAFYEEDEDGVFLWTSDTDGGNRRRIGPGGGTAGEFELLRPPAWSPDGRTIAYSRDDGCENDYCDTSEVWLAPLDAEPRLLTRGRDPSWSPDGKRIAFADGPVVAVIGADGRGRHLVAKGASPLWSPHGELIAYLAHDSQLWIVAANGSGPRMLAEVGPEDFAWSPDGASIVFGNGELWSVSVSGGKPVRVTRLRGGGSDSPAFSRGGRIAWLNLPTLEGEQSNDIYVANADGSELRRVTRKRQVIVYPPAWSADGQKLFYVPWPHLIG